MSQAKGTASELIRFEGDDQGFRQWVEGNPNGYLVNSYRPATADYLKLHRSTCRHLKLDTASNLTTDYIKTCSGNLDALRVWARERLNAELQPCHFCDPK